MFNLKKQRFFVEVLEFKFETGYVPYNKKSFLKLLSPCNS